jgi:hypothetical protein
MYGKRDYLNPRVIGIGSTSGCLKGSENLSWESCAHPLLSRSVYTSPNYTLYCTGISTWASKFGLGTHANIAQFKHHITLN